jgi:hypothetical protein
LVEKGGMEVKKDNKIYDNTKRLAEDLTLMKRRLASVELEVGHIKQRVGSLSTIAAVILDKVRNLR